jgi:O-antigen/teichoic acid export membrane protein
VKVNGRIGRNLVCNCAGVGVDALAGFLVAPFLIHRLGDSTYGLWIVLGSLTSYFGLLDLGVRGSVGRHVAFHQAKKDQARVNQTVSTAAVILAVLGLVALVGTLAAQLFFFRLFDVPSDQVAEVRVALFVVGVNLSASLVLNVFDATLWGFQRFDLLNAVDIPATLTRLGLTWHFIGQGDGLVALALISLGVTLGGGSAKVALSFFENRCLRVGPRHVRRGAARELFGYSVWSFLTSLARIACAQLSPVAVGSLLGVFLVTPFAIANRLITLVGSVLAAATGIITPLATGLHARGASDRQERLFLLGSRYCFALALMMLLLLVLLGKPLIVAWVGLRLAPAAPLLAILAAGELLPSSQYITNGMIFAAARHRSLAWLGFVELLAAGALAVVLSRPFGLPGVCLALAVPASFCRGVAQMLIGCRLAGVSVVRYCATALLPPLFCAVLPAATLLLAVRRREPQGLLEIGIYGTGFCALYLLLCGAVLARDHVRGRRSPPDEEPEIAPAVAEV